jgi:hypothetical protein
MDEDYVIHKVMFDQRLLWSVEDLNSTLCIVVQWMTLNSTHGPVDDPKLHAMVIIVVPWKTLNSTHGPVDDPKLHAMVIIVVPWKTLNSTPMHSVVVQWMTLNSTLWCCGGQF